MAAMSRLGAPCKLVNLGQAGQIVNIFISINVGLVHLGYFHNLTVGADMVD